MNINNVIRALRQSLKLQPISIYCSQAQPSLPANREFFDGLTPTLKLLLKAFKQADFTGYLSKWGELNMFSPTLGLEILIRIEPNISHMSKVSTVALKKNGYDVLEVHMPRKPYVLSYFFCGTKSKWRQIFFDTEFTSVESVYAEFIQPILKASKPFQGRLKTSLQLEKNTNFATHDTVYAFARFATNYIGNVYGLTQFCSISESKYVRECFVGNYGAVLFTDIWREMQTIKWQKNDRKFIEKHIPEMLEQYTIICPSIAGVSAENPEHQFLLEALDKAMLKVYEGADAAEVWLNQKNYSTDKKPPNLLLSDMDGTIKVLSVAVR
jgi:hypothetical protein